MKHIGFIENTGRRCAVVFRYIYDTNGKVLDKNNCLIVETESLPDYVQSDIMQIIQSEPGQRTGNLYEALNRASLSDGNNALSYLHQTNRLRKVSTNSIILTPDSYTKIKLSKINKIIELAEQGMPRDQIEEMLKSDNDLVDIKDSRVDQTNQKTNDQLAEELIQKANQLLLEATELKQLALSLNDKSFREELEELIEDIPVQE